MWRLVVAVAAMGTLACTAPLGRRDGSPTQAPSVEERPALRLDHLAPPRDVVGGTPTHFAWTPVDGADHYAIGVWNDADTLIWRRDDIRTTSVDWPKDLEIELGTYFWSVTALRGDHPLVDSGRSAFVIAR